jgi:hypothetical protein
VVLMERLVLMGVLVASPRPLCAAAAWLTLTVARALLSGLHTALGTAIATTTVTAVSEKDIAMVARWTMVMMVVVTGASNVGVVTVTVTLMVVVAVAVVVTGTIATHPASVGHVATPSTTRASTARRAGGTSAPPSIAMMYAAPLCARYCVCVCACARVDRVLL